MQQQAASCCWWTWRTRRQVQLCFFTSSPDCGSHTGAQRHFAALMAALCCFPSCRARRCSDTAVVFQGKFTLHSLEGACPPPALHSQLVAESLLSNPHPAAQPGRRPRTRCAPTLASTWAASRHWSIGRAARWRPSWVRFVGWGCYAGLSTAACARLIWHRSVLVQQPCGRAVWAAGWLAKLVSLRSAAAAAPAAAAAAALLLLARHPTLLSLSTSCAPFISLLCYAPLPCRR